MTSGGPISTAKPALAVSQTQAMVLFFGGLTVAIIGAAKMPVDGAEWPDTLPLFVAGAVVSAIGCVIWRKRRATSAAEAASAITTPDADPFALLQGMLTPARALVASVDDATLESIAADTQALLDDWVLPFAEVRQVVIDRLGMRAGAEILVTVAYGERLLNRVWSAAADGHLPEARACVPEAVDAFEEAQVMAAKAL